MQYAKITKILFQKRLRGWRLEVMSSVSILPAEISGYVAGLRINFKSASLVSSVGNSGHLRPIRVERTSRVPKGTKTRVFNVYFSNDLRQRVYSSVKIPLLWEGIFTQNKRNLVAFTISVIDLEEVGCSCFFFKSFVKKIHLKRFEHVGVKFVVRKNNIAIRIRLHWALAIAKTKLFFDVCRLHF